jgi:hypothetical protein
MTFAPPRVRVAEWIGGDEPAAMLANDEGHKLRSPANFGSKADRRNDIKPRR